jgi:hypothetical protein
MAAFKAAVLILAVASVVADPDLMVDTVSFIQSQLQEKTLTHTKEHDADVQDGYKLADECANEKPPLVQLADPLVIDEETYKVAIAATTSEPAGADTLKRALEFMIIALFLDGLRRGFVKSQGREPKDAEVACQDKASATAAWNEMMDAAKNGNVKQFNAAILRKPSVTRTDMWGCTPLHFAAMGGSMDIASKLLQQGADVDAMEANYETPLHFAARADNALICELLANAGAKVDVLNAQGMTPLMVAGNANAKTACALLVGRCGGVSGVADEDLPPLVVSKIVQKMFAVFP